MLTNTSWLLRCTEEGWDEREEAGLLPGRWWSVRGWAEKSGKRRRREKGRTFWCQIERLRGFSKRLNESLIENQRVTLAIQPKKKKCRSSKALGWWMGRWLKKILAKSISSNYINYIEISPRLYGNKCESGIPKNKYSCRCCVSLSDIHGSCITAANAKVEIQESFFLPFFIFFHFKRWKEKFLAMEGVGSKSHEGNGFRAFWNTCFIADVEAL